MIIHNLHFKGITIPPFKTDTPSLVYADTVLSLTVPFEFLQAAWQRAGRRDPVTAAALADLTSYLPCDLMVKVDIASMAHGLAFDGYQCASRRPSSIL